jgi:hypothetical protein
MASSLTAEVNASAFRYALLEALEHYNKEQTEERAKLIAEAMKRKKGIFRRRNLTATEARKYVLKYQYFAFCAGSYEIRRCEALLQIIKDDNTLLHIRLAEQDIRLIRNFLFS